MPRVLSYTPSWLSRPSPGFECFAPSSASKPSSPAKLPAATSKLKTIALRGVEVFAAVGNEIRWTDLLLLKELESSDAPSLHKTLKVPGSRTINQLAVSPLGDYIAVATSHTVYVAVLPNPEYLTEGEEDIIKLKAFQLGPTSHVLEGSPVVSILWHPLGQLGRCLVTLTADAVLRVWEINKEDRWSFDKPTLAADLKKLANATTDGQDLRASRYGVGKEFTPDTVELEPSGACFGGAGRPGEYPWASMTLWISTKTGDVYALCPLLPGKWQPYPGQVGSLSTLVASRWVECNENADDAERPRVKAQMGWAAELREQEPYLSTPATGGYAVEIISRPSRPGPVPRLQGPFNLEPDRELDDVTDIVVRNVTVGEENLEFETGEILEDEEERPAPLATYLVCLATKVGTVEVFLETEDIEAQWLPHEDPHNSTPSKFPQRVAEDETPYLSLLHIQTINFLPARQLFPTFCPSFTSDARSPFAFFVTHEQGISYFSMENLVERLQGELEDPPEQESPARAKNILESSSTAPEHLVKIDTPTYDDPPCPEFPTAVVLLDSDIGYFLLTTDGHTPRSAFLDTTHRKADSAGYSEDDQFVRQDRATSPFFPAQEREAYLDDERFHKPLSAVTAFLNSLSRNPRSEGNSLETYNNAHKAFIPSAQAIIAAAADLFRACARLEEEWQEQVRRMAEVKSRYERIAGSSPCSESSDEDEDDEDANESESHHRSGSGPGSGSAITKVEQRMQRIVQRQRDLSAKQSRLKRKMERLAGEEIGDKEAEWMAEVKKLEEELSAKGTLFERAEKVRALRKDLVAQAREMTKAKAASEEDEDDTGSLMQRARRGQGAGAVGPGAYGVAVAPGYRRAKIGRVMEALERQSAMVDAVTERLERLNAMLV